VTLRISKIETRQNSSRDPYGVGGDYVGRTGDPFSEVKVTFIADREGVYELQKVGVDGSEVSIVPGSTGYAEQCRKYEDEIAELKKKFEEVTRTLVKAVKAVKAVDSLEKQRAQVTKERNEAKRNADKEAGDAQLRAELKEAVRANGELLKQLQATRTSAPIGFVIGSGVREGELVSVDLSTGKVYPTNSRGGLQLEPRPSEVPPVSYPAEGMMISGGRYMEVVQVKIGPWTLGACLLSGECYAGEVVIVSRATANDYSVRAGTVVARRRSLKGTENVASVRKAPPEPSRFTTIELDEDE
jgi:hypothetical protein